MNNNETLELLVALFYALADRNEAKAGVQPNASFMEGFHAGRAAAFEAAAGMLQQFESAEVPVAEDVCCSARRG